MSVNPFYVDNVEGLIHQVKHIYYTKSKFCTLVAETILTFNKFDELIRYKMFYYLPTRAKARHFEVIQGPSN